MRKRLKKENRSCALCKPHKMRCGVCWKAKELAGIKEFENIKDALNIEF